MVSTSVDLFYFGIRQNVQVTGVAIGEDILGACCAGQRGWRLPPVKTASITSPDRVVHGFRLKSLETFGTHKAKLQNTLPATWNRLCNLSS